MAKQILITVPDELEAGLTYVRQKATTGIPAEIVTGSDEEGNPTTSPNPMYYGTDEEYLMARVTDILRSYKGIHDKETAPVVLPPQEPPTPVVNGVPQIVTRRQARQELSARGLLVQVQPCIDAIPDQAMREMIQIEWDDSQSFERQRPTLIQLATAPAPYGLALTLEDLDAIFISASKRV